MPGSTKPTSDIDVTTCALDSSDCYTIDTGSQDALLTATVSTLSGAGAVPDSYNAYDSTIYTFSINTTANIPIGGVLTVTLPDDLSIPNPTFTANSCAFRRNLIGSNRKLTSNGLDSTFYCTATSNSVTVVDGFQSEHVAGSETILFDIEGILNPRSLEPSASFSFLTQTSDNYDIQELTSGVTVTMLTVSEFNTVSLSSTSLVNSASTNLTFSMNAPNLLLDEDILTITFPSQLTLGSSPTCEGITNLATSLVCTLSGFELSIELNFVSDDLVANNGFVFMVTDITNAASTEPSDDFGFSIESSEGIHFYVKLFDI